MAGHGNDLQVTVLTMRQGASPTSKRMLNHPSRTCPLGADPCAASKCLSPGFFLQHPLSIGNTLNAGLNFRSCIYTCRGNLGRSGKHGVGRPASHPVALCTGEETRPPQHQGSSTWLRYHPEELGAEEELPSPRSHFKVQFIPPPSCLARLPLHIQPQAPRRDLVILADKSQVDLGGRNSAWH